MFQLPGRYGLSAFKRRSRLLVISARKDVLATGGASQHVAVLGIALQKRFLATYSRRDLDDGLEIL